MTIIETEGEEDFKSASCMSESTFNFRYVRERYKDHGVLGVSCLAFGRFHAQGASRNWVIDERDGSDSIENRAHRIYQRNSYKSTFACCNQAILSMN